jgi:hypothetical protein
MARKKPARKKKTVGRKRPTLKKPAPKKLAAKRKGPPKKKTVKKAAAGKPAARKKLSATKKKSPTKKKSAGKRTSQREVINPVTPSGRRGLGAESGGQSGDTQGLSRRSYDDSESVEELMEEGQYMEAEAVSGVENARDADQGEVRTRQFPEDDVPEEYLDKD